MASERVVVASERVVVALATEGERHMECQLAAWAAVEAKVVAVVPVS